MNTVNPSLNPSLSGERLVSLDVFRGITIAGMILVNNPGSWDYVYGPLEHAAWNGWTPTDLIFPFFLFIVGVAMAFSFRKRLEQGGNSSLMFAQVVRRTIVLFLLGLFLAGFPDQHLINQMRSGEVLPSYFFGGLSLFRLTAPYIFVIAGLAFLYADWPLFQFGASLGTQIRKSLAAALFVGAIVFFCVDFAYFQETQLRIPGVLQRIALCYFFASLIIMHTNLKYWIGAIIAILILYWVIVTGLSPRWGFETGVNGPNGLLQEWIDMRVFGVHVYKEHPDPEGLLSTLPAIVSVLIGVVTGRWMQSSRERTDKVIGLFVAANILLVLGLWANMDFPINKKIWTSSYVLATAGVALNFLAICYWLIDIRGYRKWSWPFVVFGSNAIVVYVAAGVIARILAFTKLADGKTPIKQWIFEHLRCIWNSPFNVSVAYPLIFLLILLIPMYVLYRRRIFVRI